MNDPSGGPRLGLFLLLDGDGDTRRVYDDALALIEAAEALGLHSAWVAQHHFGTRYGRLPSPLVFLAAAAARTRRIRLGTAVVTLPFEGSARLVEDAAVLDLLAGGRLELGVGSGYDPAEFAGFGLDPAQRQAHTSAALEALTGMLDGGPAVPGGPSLTPAAPGLADRLWLAVGGAGGAAHAAGRGLGILSPRVERGAESPIAAQAGVAAAYRAAWGRPDRPPRHAVARTVYPAADAATARRESAEGVGLYADELRRKGYLPPDTSAESAFERLHVLHGHPDEIAATLRAEQASIAFTDLLCQVNPGGLERGLALAALERLATHVAPQLAASRQSPGASGMRGRGVLSSE